MPPIEDADAARAAALSPQAEAQFQDAVQFLLSRIDYERAPPPDTGGDPFKLDRMAELLRRLGDPQLAIPCVHIAGSKGKGSTAAMTAAMLTAAGYRTGLFTSPHIERFEERIQIDGRMIPAAEFARHMETLRSVSRELEATDLGGPTFFELITALAWLYFRAQQIDIVVLEVGLGGRLDATNLCHPVVTIITSISRDHTRLLGNTLEAIAGEKAGIIKPGTPVLTAISDRGPLEVVRRIAAERGAACFVLGEAIELEHLGSAGVLAGERLSLRNPWRSHAELGIPLTGRHQTRNAALAVSAVDWLDTSTAYRISSAAIATGLAQTHWPLRLEVVQRAPLTIVDAAHNEASIAALVETLASVPCRRRIAIFAASKDKEARAMLQRLAAAFDVVILTRFVGNPRATPIESLERMAGEFSEKIRTSPEPAAALALAESMADRDDLICATGSFFLAAEVRQLRAASAW